MRFHYALVDDLLTWEEFERRVEEKIEACGDLVDDQTAAMMVVSELGRQHVKISRLSGRSSLFSFFAKVLLKDEVSEFEREDGEKGIRTTLLVGDETGTVRLVLWDEKAAACAELEPGDVLEVIGKHSSRSRKDITVLALRKASCEIRCDEEPGRDSFNRPVRQSCDLRLLALSEPRGFTRRNGVGGSFRDGVAADREGTARFVCWAPAILDGIDPPVTVHAEGIIRSVEDGAVEYRADEQSSITPSDADIPVTFLPLSEVKSAPSSFSCHGTVTAVGAVHEFLTRDGRPSTVRSILLDDGTASIPLTLWGEEAERPLVPGENVEVFNTSVREGRNGVLELKTGRGIALAVASLPEVKNYSTEGTVIAYRHSVILDTEGGTFVLVGLDPIPHGREARVTGILAGRRLFVEAMETIPLDPAPLQEQAKALIEGPAPAGRDTPPS